MRSTNHQKPASKAEKLHLIFSIQLQHRGLLFVSLVTMQLSRLCIIFSVKTHSKFTKFISEKEDL